eukprot:TRINITY_DN362_c0_g2_i1.p1 TRINITY_DN362_c0_g2~~TRINITY_DN362_c0_g2_i1.p1  ORF type:complete len:192 (+),score=52.52 TRINITY_DN362_c0_g2_i1:277-852(+)
MSVFFDVLDSSGASSPRFERQHIFQKKQFKKPTWCGNCEGFIWREGVFCTECEYPCHRRCLSAEVSNQKCKPGTRYDAEAKEKREKNIQQTKALRRQEKEKRDDKRSRVKVSSATLAADKHAKAEADKEAKIDELIEATDEVDISISYTVSDMSDLCEANVRLEREKEELEWNCGYLQDIMDELKSQEFVL